MQRDQPKFATDTEKEISLSPEMLRYHLESQEKLVNYETVRLERLKAQLARPGSRKLSIEKRAQLMRRMQSSVSSLNSSNVILETLRTRLVGSVDG
jgi:hypothetical protein